MKLVTVYSVTPDVSSFRDTIEGSPEGELEGPTPSEAKPWTSESAEMGLPPLCVPGNPVATFDVADTLPLLLDGALPDPA